jgi:hypothetical protein
MTMLGTVIVVVAVLLFAVFVGPRFRQLGRSVRKGR